MSGVVASTSVSTAASLRARASDTLDGVPAPRTCKTRAIVLSHFDLGEADRIVTLLTPEDGKVRAIAKGVRRPQQPHRRQRRAVRRARRSSSRAVAPSTSSPRSSVAPRLAATPRRARIDRDGLVRRRARRPGRRGARRRAPGLRAAAARLPAARRRHGARARRALVRVGPRRRARRAPRARALRRVRPRCSRKASASAGCRRSAACSARRTRRRRPSTSASRSTRSSCCARIDGSTSRPSRRCGCRPRSRRRSSRSCAATCATSSSARPARWRSSTRSADQDGRPRVTGRCRTGHHGAALDEPLQAGRTPCVDFEPSSRCRARSSRRPSIASPAGAFAGGRSTPATTGLGPRAVTTTSRTLRASCASSRTTPGAQNDELNRIVDQAGQHARARSPRRPGSGSAS